MGGGDRNMNGSKQKSRRRILKDIIAQDGTHQMVIFNEEEEESKSRYDDYSQAQYPVNTANEGYLKQFGATVGHVPNTVGLLHGGVADMSDEQI